jgi:hypothetical protein
MKKVVMLALISTLAAASFAAEVAKPAQPVATVQENPMVWTLDATYVTKYIWRGFDMLDDKAAFQPSANLALENGLNFNVWSSWAGASKNDGDISTVDKTQFNYTVSYKNNFGEDCGMTQYNVGWRYYDFTKIDSERADMQEGFIELAWPNIIGNGFVPRYAYYYMWGARSGGEAAQNGGPIHDLGIDYNWTFESMPELPMKFSVDAVYNDGTGASDVDHDWSHILWGLSTKFDLAGGKVTPALWYQTSMEDTVNENDEFWGGLSYALTF